jgi:hypothetical protein
MTHDEQVRHDSVTDTIRSALKALKYCAEHDASEDLNVAIARLENWLAENDRRWVA